MEDAPHNCTECHNFERWWTGFEFLFVCTLLDVILGDDDDLEKLEAGIVGGNSSVIHNNITVERICPFKL